MGSVGSAGSAASALPTSEAAAQTGLLRTALEAALAQNQELLQSLPGGQEPGSGQSFDGYA